MKLEFKAKEVTEITGVSRERLQQWLTREYIVPSIQIADGAGTRNIYSVADLCTIEVFKKLVESGWSRELVGKFMLKGAISDEVLDKIPAYILYMRRQNEMDAALITSEDGVINLAEKAKDLDLVGFDDCYILNFRKIHNKVLNEVVKRIR